MEYLLHHSARAGKIEDLLFHMLYFMLNLPRSFSRSAYNFGITVKMGSKLKIGTHNGVFHCDEVLACSMLKHAKPEYSNAEIVRSRNMEILKDCDIVVDVGAVYDPSCHRYDHHQRSFNHTMNTLNQEYPWTVKLSSAGLVYFHFGHEIIANVLKLPVDSEEVKILYKKVYENFIQEIDAIDNGIKPCNSEHKYDIHTHLSSRVKHLNPSWNEVNPNQTKCFEKACQLVEQEFLDRINFYGKTWLPARDIIKSAVQNRFSVHSSGEIIELANGNCPWNEHLFELEESLKVEKPIKFVIYPDTINKAWTVQCVSIALFSFEIRLSLRKDWCGLQGEELSKQSGIDGCVFVHTNGFIGGNKTREGTFQMALRTLNPE